ncbi:MAG: hypothetical protein ACYCZA_12355 [Thiobacillus sp.]
MSGPVGVPCNGIKAQSKSVESRNSPSGVRKTDGEAEPIKAPQSDEWALDMSLAEAVGVSTSVRPGRGRNRTKTELEEKTKKPAEDGRKKSPPSRKAPARGRYVDEYARPAL